ncbi:MAG: hypothetical protein FWF59_11585 [Turicibacter sp.]|nr:hypothetical protein [Turicibacter sp.]
MMLLASVLDEKGNKTKERIDLSQYVTRVELLKMGFTDKLIEALLPKPVSARNHTMAGHPIYSYWKKEAVERAQESEQFKERQNRLGHYGQDAAGIAREVMEQARNMKIRVKKITEEALRARAIEAQRKWLGNHGIVLNEAAVNEGTIIRWARNYVRHDLTDYDDVWRTFHNKPGGVEAYECLLKRVEDEISAVYPFYGGLSTHKAKTSVLGTHEKAPEAPKLKTQANDVKAIPAEAEKPLNWFDQAVHDGYMNPSSPGALGRESQELLEAFKNKMATPKGKGKEQPKHWFDEAMEAGLWQHRQKENPPAAKGFGSALDEHDQELLKGLKKNLTPGPDKPVEKANKAPKKAPEKKPATQKHWFEEAGELGLLDGGTFNDFPKNEKSGKKTASRPEAKTPKDSAQAAFDSAGLGILSQLKENLMAQQQKQAQELKQAKKKQQEISWEDNWFLEAEKSGYFDPF